MHFYCFKNNVLLKRGMGECQEKRYVSNLSSTLKAKLRLKGMSPPVTGFSVRMEEMIKVELNMSDLKFRKNPHLKCP